MPVAPARRAVLAALFLCLLAPSVTLAQRAPVGRPPPPPVTRAEAPPSRTGMSVLPQRPGVRDLYVVSVAGWGGQRVFEREVRRVTDMMEQHYDARGRSIRLVNTRSRRDATVQSLAQALRTVREAMDPEEDVLFLFMTSHGAPHSGFALEAEGESFGNIGPGKLARLLQTTGIRNRVIIVSACYSGQFVPPLANDDTLVITAASADRPSFGCTDRAQWTWFGEAFFLRALPETRRLVSAFRRARVIVREMERRENQNPSNPQMAVGRRIVGVLQEMGL